MRLRYKTRVGMTAAPAAASLRCATPGSAPAQGAAAAGAPGPRRRPVPGPRTQVNQGFGPGTPRWPQRSLGAPAPRPPRAQAARRPRCGGACGQAERAPKGSRRGSRPGPPSRRREGCGQDAAWAAPRTPPLLTLSGVSRPCSCSSACRGSLSVPRGRRVLGGRPGRTRGNKLGT